MGRFFTAYLLMRSQAPGLGRHEIHRAASDHLLQTRPITKGIKRAVGHLKHLDGQGMIPLLPKGHRFLARLLSCRAFQHPPPVHQCKPRRFRKLPGTHRRRDIQLQAFPQRNQKKQFPIQSFGNIAIEIAPVMLFHQRQKVR